MSRYDNIVLTDTGESLNFSSTPKIGGGLRLPIRNNIQAHSDLLNRQFQEAQNKFNTFTPQQISAVTYNTGTYVEFVGAENCDLLTKSLEDARQGIRLLNVRTVVIPNTDEQYPKTVTKATVFIPTGKQQIFIDKITEYATLLTTSGKPKNNNLVSSIENINNAITISAFWVGRISDLPNSDNNWYELWFDVQEETATVTLSNAFDLLDRLSIQHKPHNEIIRFPERAVVLVFCNQNNLLDIIKQGVTLAEIRKPADPNVFFVNSSLIEQSEWANNLQRRATVNNSGVAVCILDTGINANHSLLLSAMPTRNVTVENAWGIADNNGHGTNMAGIALYDNLKEILLTNRSVTINHFIESVKIIEPNSTVVTVPKLYGVTTENAILIPEINNPQIHRIYCMAVTAEQKSGNGDGSPSSWSGAIDNITSNRNNKRLIIISAGNVTLNDLNTAGYPDACLKTVVEDPGQSWNALTVGAYSASSDYTPDDLHNGYRVVAQGGELSPYSSTSSEFTSWKSQWPIKPEVVCDGGNAITDGTNFDRNDNLSLLTLSHDITRRLFWTIEATSAATAKCSFIAGELLAHYPELWPETIRALIVHSAEWTDQMKRQFGSLDTKTLGRKKLLHTCGYGVPNLERAKDTLTNRVNMIIQGEIQPYEKIQGHNPKTKEMHIHNIPWPQSVLQSLGNENVKLKLTLSYFIEPGPGEKGWKNKYRYASCGLRFDIKRPQETIDDFKRRINNAMRDDDYQNTNTTSNNWYLGQNRDVGSIHSDTWHDTAINLAESGIVAVYPVIGWWKERANLGKYNSKVRYSLVVTIETPSNDIDLYTPIMTVIAQRVTVQIRNENN
jgi:subtilisin family serine protease